MFIEIMIILYLVGAGTGLVLAFKDGNVNRSLFLLFVIVFGGSLFNSINFYRIDKLEKAHPHAVEIVPKDICVIT